MIDNIKITLQNFSGNLEKCSLQGTEVWVEENKQITYKNYSLSNLTKFGEEKLKVVHKVELNIVTITGSIRKWRAGYNNLTDITSNEFVWAMEKIAHDLMIPYEELLKGEITRCEVGLNIKLSKPCSEVIPKIVAYGQYKRINYKNLNESIYFYRNNHNLKLKGDGELPEGNKVLIIYDKIGEISSGKKKRSVILEEYNENYLRIEFFLENKNDFKAAGLKHIKTVCDLVKNYSDLYLFFSKYANNIRIQSSIDFKRKKMSKSEFLLGTIFNSSDFNFDEFKNDYLNFLDSKAVKGLAGAKSKARSEIINTLENFYSLDEYNKGSFRTDIGKRLVEISKKEENFNLQQMFINLWNVKKRKKIEVKN